MSLLRSVLKKAEESFQILEKEFGALRRANIELREMGMIAGRVITKEEVILINPLFETNHRKELIKEIVPHEVAHWATWILYQDLSHGANWKKLMEVLGLEPKVYHDFSLDGVVPFIPYFCGCREYQIPIQRHKFILRGYNRICENCNTILKSYEKVA